MASEGRARLAPAPPQASGLLSAVGHGAASLGGFDSQVHATAAGAGIGEAPDGLDAGARRQVRGGMIFDSHVRGPAGFILHRGKPFRYGRGRGPSYLVKTGGGNMVVGLTSGHFLSAFGASSGHTVTMELSMPIIALWDSVPGRRPSRIKAQFDTGSLPAAHTHSESEVKLGAQAVKGSGVASSGSRISNAAKLCLLKNGV